MFGQQGQQTLPKLEIPPPSDEEQAFSEQLAEHIRQQIDAAGGRISFERFMAAALYTPGLGYYSAGMQKFGRDGDFVTAPEISSLFSRCLAQQCMEVLDHLNGGDILEFGAGSGRMAADILKALQQHNALPRHYYIMELSGELRQRQQQTINDSVGDIDTQIIWLDELPRAFEGVVLANELLDAMPVHVIRMHDNALSEAYVGYKDEDFVWIEDSVSDERIERALSELNLSIYHDYVSEVNLNANAWVETLESVLKRAVVILLDYGYPRNEYYHLKRQQGTLICHYKHRVVNDPLMHVGLQDITAFVDFTAVAEQAQASGLDVLGYTTQSAFLMHNGIDRLMPHDASMEESYKLAQEIKTLMMPTEMGELIKVLVLAKGYEGPVAGIKDNRLGML